MRIQSRYLLTLSCMILVVVVTMASLLLVQFDKTLQAGIDASDQAMQQDLYMQLERKGLSINQVLATNLTNPLYSYDTNEMFEQLQSVLRLPDVQYVIIYAPNGSIVHDGDEAISRFGEIPDDPFVAATLNSNTSLIQKSDNLLDISTPIFIGDRRLGGVRLGLSLDSIQTEVDKNHAELAAIFSAGTERNLLTVTLISLLMLLLFGGFLAIWISRSISLPIRRLANYARHVGDNPDQHVDFNPDQRDDELSELGQSFCEMVKRLEDSKQQVSYQANHDQLTDLPNRLLLNSFLDHALERAARKHNRMAVLFLDLDDFKRINDTLGHSAGDDLLQQFSKRLQSCLRGDDYLGTAHDNDRNHTVARLGGDEFTLILDDIRNAASAAIVAERILSRARSPFKLSQGQEVVVGASIGITIYPDDGSDRNALLRNADIAMYSAKAAGKNNFAFFADSMNLEVQHRLAIERNLRLAINQHQLELYYQPLFDQRQQKIYGVEALLRWPQTDNSFIPPDEFVPIAEQTGLIVELGDWVLARACQQTQNWLAQGLADIHCAVNISGVQLRNKQLVNQIQQLLEKTGLSPQYLQVELTETAILTNEDFAKTILAELNQLGIDIWMDDFGTGYSSLSLLKKFNVQGVKIDHSFVADMTDNDNSCTIINATIAMAKSLNLCTVAEGVETPAQLALLEGLQCDFIQGFYLAEPMPADELERLMIEQPDLFLQPASTELSRSQQP